MKTIMWAKALTKIRSGEKAVCPECGKGAIKADYKEIVKGDGIIVLFCPVCEKGLHFSHQKGL